VFFLPLIVKGLGVSTDWIGLVSALPYLCAFVGMIAWGYHSDLTGERLWHVGGALFAVRCRARVCILIGVGHPVVTNGGALRGDDVPDVQRTCVLVDPERHC